MIKRILLLLMLAICGSIAFADETSQSPEIRSLCADALKKIDSHYRAPKNLINKNSQSISAIVQCDVLPGGRPCNCRPVQTIPVEKRGPFESDLYVLETAMIEAIQQSQPLPFPTAQLNPGMGWTLTYTRQPLTKPATKVELNQGVWKNWTN